MSWVVGHSGWYAYRGILLPTVQWVIISACGVSATRAEEKLTSLVHLLPCDRPALERSMPPFAEGDRNTHSQRHTQYYTMGRFLL